MKQLVLWKSDTELGIAYLCPHCKRLVTAGDKCRVCEQELDWNVDLNKQPEYKGKIKWD